jgi:hypothetical protein
VAPVTSTRQALHHFQGILGEPVMGPHWHVMLSLMPTNFSSTLPNQAPIPFLPCWLALGHIPESQECSLTAGFEQIKVSDQTTRTMHGSSSGCMSDMSPLSRRTADPRTRLLPWPNQGKCGSGRASFRVFGPGTPVSAVHIFEFIPTGYSSEAQGRA